MEMIVCNEILALDHSFSVAELVLSSSRGLHTKEISNDYNNKLQLHHDIDNATEPLAAAARRSEEGHGSIVSLPDIDVTLLHSLEVDEDLQQILDLISN